MNNNGEFGHCVLDRSRYANICQCGKKGCRAAYGSGLGMIAEFQKKLKKNITPHEFFQLVNQGNLKAKELLLRIRDFNAQGIGNMCNSLEVDFISIMGSIGLKQFSRVIPKKHEIQKYCINKIPRIVPSRIGPNIKLHGAFLIGKQKHKKLENNNL